MTALLLPLLVLLAAPLAAQTRAPFQPAAEVSVPQRDTVRLALDTVPRTIATLVARTTLPEPVVRSAVAQLVAAKTVRYRLIPVASGDTTASGRVRRERAYYLPTTQGTP
jgi:hypothetical protein